MQLGKSREGAGGGAMHLGKARASESRKNWGQRAWEHLNGIVTKELINAYPLL